MREIWFVCNCFSFILELVCIYYYNYRVHHLAGSTTPLFSHEIFLSSETRNLRFLHLFFFLVYTCIYVLTACVEKGLGCFFFIIIIVFPFFPSPIFFSCWAFFFLPLHGFIDSRTSRRPY